MRALVYTGPQRIEVAEVPDPRPAEGEVLVRVAHAGICGSDVHAFLGHDERRPPPLILGHEIAGTVASGGRPGRRVTVNPLVTCGACAACRSGRENLCERRQILSMPPRQGGFAEYVAVPERNLVDIPEGVPTWKAALVEPLACGWHAVRLAAELLRRPLDGVRALVLGGGAIGLGAALVLAAHGVRDVLLAEANPERRAVAARAGRPFGIRAVAADEDPQAAPELVVDAVGSETTRARASALVRPGGLVVHIGLASAGGGLDVRRATLWEIGFVGSYTYTMADFRATAAAVFEGRLGGLDWVEIRPLEAGPQAFADIVAGRVAAPKIVLEV